MKIALFSDTYPPEINGVATSVATLKRILEEHGHEVLVVTTNPFSNDVLYENGVIRIPGIELKRYYGYRLAGIYNDKAMKIIAREFKPDLVHVHMDGGIGAFGIHIASKYHVGCVYTYHTMVEDYAHYVTKGHFDRVARHTLRGFFRVRLRPFDEIISPSEKSKDYLRFIGINEHISVIPTGIDLQKFAVKDEKAIQAIKEKWHLNDDEYLFLSLGRIAKEKSVDVLLRGYAAFLKANPNAKTRFLIVGLGPDIPLLQSLTEDLGIADHVIFTGPCPSEEVQNYYHLCSCFLSASLTETQGLTYMEAMASGEIVLARHCENLFQVIEDGKNGFFFFSEEELAEKMSLVMKLGQKRKEAILYNGKMTVEAYSLERFYQSIMEVYRRAQRKKW